MRKKLDTQDHTQPGSVAAAAPFTSPTPDGTSPVTGGSAALPSKLRSRFMAQLVSFGFIGGLAFIVDLTVYNVVRATILEGSPIWSKVVSVTVATAVAWLGNRYLTFRRERSRPALREGVLFALVNIGGLLIAAGCLFVSHYVLGFTSQLADNISGNGVGLVLGTAFRFVAYRWLVFSPAAPAAPVSSTARTSRAPLVPKPAPRIVRTDSGGLS